MRVKEPLPSEILETMRQIVFATFPNEKLTYKGGKSNIGNSYEIEMSNADNTLNIKATATNPFDVLGSIKIEEV